MGEPATSLKDGFMQIKLEILIFLSNCVSAIIANPLYRQRQGE